MRKDQENPFLWWVGVVEDRKDPLKLGRVRVRCVNWHSDNKMQLPTTQLPWAIPMLPVNNNNPYAMREGDMVVGFFTDGTEGQEPVVMGILPGIPLRAANIQQGFNDPRTNTELANSPRSPESKTYNTDGSGITITEKARANNYPNILDEPTTSRIARNDSITQTFIQERKDNRVTNVSVGDGNTWSEPETQYAAVYPYNNVVETESGHVTEFDDTPGKERIHMAHRNGSFVEWFPDGDKVEKVTKDNYSVIMGNDHLYVMGDVKITVQGNANVYVQKNVALKVDGNMSVDVGGTYSVTSDGNMTFNAPRIDLN